MATKVPYVASPGTMAKIFDKIRNAQTPERFTGDLLETKLGFRGGNARQFIPLAKRLGFLGSDGRPSDIYNRFRNAGTSKAAMAQALKVGYAEIFERNEYANSLTKEEFKGLVIEVTGLDSKNRVVQLICQTFETLKKLADFDATAKPEEKEETTEKESADNSEVSVASRRSAVGLNLAYTINLVLPKTEDPAVFTAIFKSLRDTLLRS